MESLASYLASPLIRQRIINGQLKTAFSDVRLHEEGEKKGQFVQESLEALVQPSSFEPTLGEEIFVLDTETKGIFRPQREETVYRALLQLPGRQRQRFSIADGFELKKGFTYLLPLNERDSLLEHEIINSSPKSTFGRLFLNTRLLADYTPCFDEISGQFTLGRTTQFWLLVQPLAFNLVVYPTFSLNQLRFADGLDARLTDGELLEEYRKNALLHQLDSRGNLTPVQPFISGGLQIHLNLSGRDSEGVVALRARHNPTPLDLRQGNYDAEHFFEPIVSKNARITVKRGEHYLLSSREILQIPPHLNVELESHSHVGLSGPLHFAGFVDNGFEGDLVFEVRSDELANIELEDNMPISKLRVFRTSVPDKLYGATIGSHYQRQRGPRPAKYFKPFDYAFVARNYKKLNRDVLVQDAALLLQLRRDDTPFQFIEARDRGRVHALVEQGFFQSRYDCEFDELVLQPIPYVLLFGPERTVFSYVRASDIKDYGDARLFGKHSVGVGGHVTREDAPYFIRQCLEREVEEEVQVQGGLSEPRMVGTLMAYDTAVDRVHFGLIFGLHTEGKIEPKELSLVSGKMTLIADIMGDPQAQRKFETWSKILIPHLSKIYKLSKQ